MYGLELELEFPESSKDASKPAVSWLNFEPRSRNLFETKYKKILPML